MKRPRLSVRASDCDCPDSSRGRTGIVALALLLFAMAGCGPEAPNDQRPEASPNPGQGARVIGEVPSPGGPAGYVASASCVECHREEHASWRRSFHRTMTQLADTNAVVAAFDGAVLQQGSDRFTLTREGGEYWVRIEDLDELAKTPRGSPPPPPVHVRVRMVTGSHHMQVFWLPAGHGNAQIGFPFTWLIADHRWVPRNDVFLRDPDGTPPVETWNMTCIRCHTTAGQPRPRREQEVFETRVGELGIACEACHGPGEAHVAAMKQFALERASNPAAKPPALLAITQPAKLDHLRSSQTCGQCHGMKWFDREEPWVEEGFRFRPGDDLEATTPLIRPSRRADQPWLEPVLRRHPGLLDEFFWPDGMIRVAGREFNGLVESPCFQRGQMSCLSCHSMHDYLSTDDQLGKDRDGDAACVQCHQDPRHSSPAHTHHPPGSSGALCYNCHLPHTSYALMKAVRQHQVESPEVARAARGGRIPACNLCHLDRSLGWTAARLKDWYGQAEPEVSAEERDTPAAVRWLMAGDAGQRALAAWHFGWEPAMAASGTSWQAPLLARLLEDPYPAVRYIAHRSLRRQPGFSKFDFDFVGPAEARHRAVGEVVRLRKTSPASARPGIPDDSALDALQARRDNRVVHLRE